MHFKPFFERFFVLCLLKKVLARVIALAKIRFILSSQQNALHFVSQQKVTAFCEPSKAVAFDCLKEFYSFISTNTALTVPS